MGAAAAGRGGRPCSGTTFAGSGAGARGRRGRGPNGSRVPGPGAAAELGPAAQLRRLTRSRARAGAIGFGLSALLCMVLGQVFEDAAWYSSAVLLAILAVAWGVTAALLPGSDRSS